METKVLDALYRRARRIYGDGRIVARRSGIPTGRLQSMRKGDLGGWTTSMVERLARTAMVDAAVVWAGAEVAAGPTIKFLRAGSWPDFHQADLETLMKALARAASLRSLGVQLGLDVLEFRPQAPVHRRPYVQAYALAEHVREELGRPTEPLVDLGDLVARRFAVYVLARSMKTARLEAAAIKDAHGEAIVLNIGREHRAVMMRRSIAHELCHLLFDPRERGVQTALDATEALGSGGAAEPAERRARAFAAELLVPRRGLLELLGPPRGVETPDEALALVSRVAEHFLAPPQLAAFHVANHRYIATSIKEYVAERAREVGMPDCEETTPDVLGEYVDRAVGAGIITAGRGRELQLLDLR